MVDSSFIKRKNARYAYYDTAGQQAYRSIFNLYFKGTDAAILMYSVNDLKTFSELNFYHNKIQEELPDCLIYIVGCKNDLETHVDKQLVHKTF